MGTDYLQVGKGEVEKKGGRRWRKETRLKEDWREEKEKKILGKRDITNESGNNEGKKKKNCLDEPKHWKEKEKSVGGKEFRGTSITTR